MKLTNIKFKKYYITPFNDLSIQLERYLNEKYPENKLLYFIDKNRVNENVKNHINLAKEDVLFIFSPNYYKEISKCHLHCKKIYVFEKSYREYYFYDNIYQYELMCNFYNSFFKFLKKSLFLKDVLYSKTYTFFRSNKDIEKLKNKYENKTCLILGNGPSLKDIDNELLEKYITFGSNGIFLKYLPNLYITISNDFYENYKEQINNLKSEYKFTDVSKIAKLNNSFIFLNCAYPTYGNFLNYNFPVPLDFSIRPDKYIFLGGSVIFVQIQLAIWMGFKRIVLLGVDHNMVTDTQRRYGGVRLNDKEKENIHFTKKYISATHSDILATERAFEIAKKYCERYDIEIVNATPNTKLNIIEKINLNDIGK